MWSYRDPQIKATIGTFDGAADFLSDLELSERAVEDYIISCVRNLDNPLTPQAQGYICSLLYLSGRSDDRIQQERDELLGSTLADIRALGEMMKPFMSGRACCTVGNSENITANSSMYDEISKL